ncbi:uncharacterized protein STEHIDRAFT_86348 [Stereum hirsutum FP-91666 SS1]|uniref:uncharacterized protein n=1 Tax=Stereum hirsutum (strain FP-91666) TaxID=721885 RepID=UPI00044497B4|nr:uncharacterized protein STEHIDRAFT_86348 [Stereum hirsutum FP-91666 SS1]EIM81083.1 hypothetical protein STEHIDRAFT_86348 [Stereum hirsutum FP-91666 SS1]
MTTTTRKITLNPPNTTSFQPSISLDHIIGTWHVTHSTLPLWKNKKDVTISYTEPTYTPSGSPQSFNDIVEYRSLSSPPSKPRTVINGVDTLDLASPESAPTRFKWRGKGWLMIASSKWQLLGYNPPGEDGEEWAVTFFEKTLFTPPGLDVYARTEKGLPEDLIKGIVESLKGLGNEEITKLADTFFEVQRSGTSQ